MASASATTIIAFTAAGTPHDSNNRNNDSFDSTNNNNNNNNNNNSVSHSTYPHHSHNNISNISNVINSNGRSGKGPCCIKKKPKTRCHSEYYTGRSSRSSSRSNRSNSNNNNNKKKKNRQKSISDCDVTILLPAVVGDHCDSFLSPKRKREGHGQCPSTTAAAQLQLSQHHHSDIHAPPTFMTMNHNNNGDINRIAMTPKDLKSDLAFPTAATSSNITTFSSSSSSCHRCQDHVIISLQLFIIITVIIMTMVKKVMLHRYHCYYYYHCR